MLTYSRYGFMVKSCLYDFYRRNRAFMAERYKSYFFGFHRYVRDIRKLVHAQRHEILKLKNINLCHIADYWNSITLSTNALERANQHLVIEDVDYPQIFIKGNNVKVNFSPFTLKKVQ